MSKEHINLPKTAFSMKANLPNKEPGIIEYWQQINLYEKLREKSKGKEKFILSILPSGLIRNKLCIIGSSVVIDPVHFLNEIMKTVTSNPNL